jgi:inorganic pyrophosphatase
MKSYDFTGLPPFDPESNMLNIVVETPRDGRIKYKYNETYGLFQFDKALPYGFSFPFEFGFVPSTLGGDGDPLDVLVLSDEPTFPGCLILGDVLGVLRANQREGRKSNRNDRILAVPVNVKNQKPVALAKALDKNLISEITKFFVYYNEIQGRKFKSLGFGNRRSAMEVVREARQRHQKQQA